MLLMKFGTKNQYFPAMNFRVFFEFWGLIRMATIWVTCKAFPYCSNCLNYVSSFWFRRHLEVRFFFRAQRRLISGTAALLVLGVCCFLLSSGVLGWPLDFEDSILQLSRFFED